MQIKFLGAAGTVTGSSYILTSDSNQSIVIDVGMFQGLPNIENLNFQPYAQDCSLLIGAVLTHAHLDHCGRLPILLPKGFTGNFFMTEPTIELTQLSLLDAAKIAKVDKKKALYDKELVEQTYRRFLAKEYRQPFEIGDFTVTFINAGHLLGAASVLIEDRSAKTEIRRIVFSGDLGNSPEKLLEDLEFINAADSVVMESTYGDRLHPKEDPTVQLAAEIQAVQKSGGALLIPTFSLERCQELLHFIKHLKESGSVSKDLPIFVDSPMAQKATAIYLRQQRFMSQHVQQELHGTNPFEFPGIEVLMTREESEAVHKRPGAKVIMAGSGMMTGGRILGHAAHYFPVKSTRLFFVGYQGEGTMGRAILEGSREVMIDKMNVQINASINSTSAMSSHADQGQLINWLKQVKGVKKVILTHGEDVSRQALSAKISEQLGMTGILLPKLNQQLSI